MSIGPEARILAAGRLLIGAKGFGFTTQDLIREAGVALQTFYRYFGSKDRLLLALISQLIKEHCVGLAESARHLDDPIGRLEFYVRMTLSPLHSSGRAELGKVHQLRTLAPPSDIARRS